MFKPQVFSLFSGAVLLGTFMAISPSRVAAADLSDLTYSVVGDEVWITDCYWDARGVLEIPSMIEGKPVTRIANYGFSDTSYLSSVVIPEGVISIGMHAFYLSGISQITIPNSVTDIGGGAFSNSDLTSCTLPDGITTLSPGVFVNCNLMTQVPIPDSVAVIGESALFQCFRLESVTIPDAVTNIGRNAFYRCSGLTCVEIPRNVVLIGNDAFEDCASLTRVKFRGNAPSISTVPFPTSNSGFEYTRRVGATGFINSWGAPIIVRLEIRSGGLDPSGNFMIDTDALNTIGLKILHAPNLTAPFTEVAGITAQGEGSVIVPSSTESLQAMSGFFKVIHE
jgi:hypothetical protein